MPWQEWVLFALLLLSSLLALSSFIAARAPQAQKALSQLAIAQGGIGIATLAWGLYRVIVFITSYGGLRIIIYILALALAIGLGLLLGYALIKRGGLTGTAVATGDTVQAKLSKNQIQLGFAGLVVAVLMLLLSF